AASATAVPWRVPNSTPASAAVTWPGKSARPSRAATRTKTSGPAGPACSTHRRASDGSIPATVTAANAAAIARARTSRRRTARRRSVGRLTPDVSPPLASSCIRQTKLSNFLGAPADARDLDHAPVAVLADHVRDASEEPPRGVVVDQDERREALDADRACARG